MYRAVIFDLGRVLVDFDFRRGFQALEPLCPYSAEEIPERLRTTRLVEEFETGLIEPHDFVAQLAKLLDFDIAYDRFCAIWNSIFAETLVPDSLLESLAARYRLLEGRLHHIAIGIFWQQRREGFLADAGGVFDDAVDVGFGQEAQQINAAAGHAGIGGERDHVDAPGARQLRGGRHRGGEQRTENDLRAFVERLLRNLARALRAAGVDPLPSRDTAAAAWNRASGWAADPPGQ